jgi:hypothetical protein
METCAACNVQQSAYGLMVLHFACVCVVVLAESWCGGLKMICTVKKYLEPPAGKPSFDCSRAYRLISVCVSSNQQLGI